MKTAIKIILILAAFAISFIVCWWTWVNGERSAETRLQPTIDSLTVLHAKDTATIGNLTRQVNYMNRVIILGIEGKTVPYLDYKGVKWNFKFEKQ